MLVCGCGLGSLINNRRHASKKMSCCSSVQLNHKTVPLVTKSRLKSILKNYAQILFYVIFLTEKYSINQEIEFHICINAIVVLKKYIKTLRGMESKTDLALIYANARVIIAKFFVCVCAGRGSRLGSLINKRTRGMSLWGAVLCVIYARRAACPLTY